MTTMSTLRRFTTADATVCRDLAVEGDGWSAACTQAQAFRLFEVPDPGVDECRVIYRASLKTDSLTGRAYLEMWCRFPGRGEFFSKGLNQILTGSNAWTSCETPFLLKPGEKPDLIRLNLVVQAVGWLWKRPVTGRIWIRNVELVSVPLG